MDAPFTASDEPVGLQSVRAAHAVRLGWPVAATLLIATYAVIVSFLVIPSNVDVSWLLVIGERVLDGARLSVDIIEVNPAFSVWLYLPFVLLGRLTGLSAELWVSIGVTALAIASVWFSARIAARANETLKRHLWTVPASVFFVLFLFPDHFGEREQIAIIALLPWLALFRARDRTVDFSAGSVAERIIAGVGAGVFVMIKPPYSVLPLAVPAVVIALQRRSLHPLLTAENLIGAALTVAYLATLAVFMQPFFTDVMPLLRQVYLPMRMPVVDVLMLWQVTMFVAMAVATLAMASPGRPDRDAGTMLLAGAAYVPAFVIMGKGWTYQAVPFLTLGILALMLQYVRLKPLRSLPLTVKAGAALGLFSIVLLTALQHGTAFTQSRRDLDAATAAILRAVDHPTIMSIASCLQATNPLTRMTGARFVARQQSGWMFDDAGILIRLKRDAAIRQDLAALRERYALSIAGELTAKRPDIVVDDGTAGPHTPVLLDLTDQPPMPSLHDNPAIARVLSDYRLLHQNRSVTVLIRADIATRD
ncbi:MULTISPECIES: hypothetical protein [unclassified Mesorhizobium]|uniref:hypothetical protein n=1 Tax=unclassified Mesorhizobium TaxID=325217 RepID=UPI0011272B62|nr:MULTISPECIES: hypothetical protein [unclassified Mesorhizobium]TPJ50462.1 hypothetical protein FJ426_24985 [Mesorhizobium sp. B2-6-4]TPM90241.1 hypothetical protein FJ966_27050 [Mesorhizobium sp. B2-1-5]